MNSSNLLLIALSLFLIASGSGCDPVPPPDPDPVRKPIGVNLARCQDWSSEFVFKDAFKMSREWTQINVINAATVAGFVIPLRDDGYPLAIPFASGGINLGVRTYMFTGADYPIPSGEYTLLAEGQGSIRIQQIAGGATRTLECPGSLVFPVNPSGMVILDILRSEAADPVRNVRLVMPGFADTYEAEPFFPDFLDFLRDFHCIRFMNWMRTNGSNIVSWEQRTPADYYSQTLPFHGASTPHRGVAYEYMTLLCNTLQKDAWVNIPHQADDDYIENFARFLKNNLDPSLKIYLEYSNELWNLHSDFTQTVWIGNRGATLGYPGDLNNQRRLFTAKRSADVFRIFEGVFGEAAPTRLVKVLAGQAVNPFIAETILNAFVNNLENVNPDGVQADALAIAPYFGNAVAIVADVDGALDNAAAHMTATTFPGIRNHLNMLASRGWDIPLIAYEGGQHLHSSNGMSSIFCEANRNERMRELYCQYFDFWYENAGGLFVHYTSIAPCSSRGGNWGLKEYPAQPAAAAPKYRAILECVLE